MGLSRIKRVTTPSPVKISVYKDIHYYYGFLWLHHSNLNFQRGPTPKLCPGPILALGSPVNRLHDLLVTQHCQLYLAGHWTVSAGRFLSHQRHQVHDPEVPIDLMAYLESASQGQQNDVDQYY